VKVEDLNDYRNPYFVVPLCPGKMSIYHAKHEVLFVGD
jgi:hypothetical protein